MLKVSTFCSGIGAAEDALKNLGVEHLIDLGMPLTAVQSLLCHRSINSTKVYAGKREKTRVDKELLGKLNDIKLV